MSDRLWLGPTAMAWADVNLCEQPSALAAIKAIQGLPGPRKVIGTVAQIQEFRTAWSELFRSDDDVWLDPGGDAVSWRAD